MTVRMSKDLMNGMNGHAGDGIQVKIAFGESLRQ